MAPRHLSTPWWQAVLQKELAAQGERKGRAAARADKLAAKLRQQRPQDAGLLELDIELAQLQDSNKALLQVGCGHACMLPAAWSTLACHSSPPPPSHFASEAPAPGQQVQ